MQHSEELRTRKGRTVGWLAAILFILTIPLGNWVVMNVGWICPPDSPCLVPVWPGLMAPSGVLLAGVALVLRDLVHHSLGGRWAVYCIFGGAVISGVISDPSLVIASTVAFLFSELADFAVYVPLRNKFPSWAVIASGLAGSVVDSALFLYLAFGSLDYLAGQVLGKFWMSLIVGIGIALMHRWRAAQHSQAVAG